MHLVEEDEQEYQAGTQVFPEQKPQQLDVSLQKFHEVRIRRKSYLIVGAIDLPHQGKDVLHEVYKQSRVSILDVLILAKDPSFIEGH